MQAFIRAIVIQCRNAPQNVGAWVNVIARSQGWVEVAPPLPSGDDLIRESCLHLLPGECPSDERQQVNA